MRPFISIVLLILTLPLTSFKENQDLENEKYLNFFAAIENNSTFSYFTVIKAKNLNTGVIKEICTKANYVLGALYMELNAGFDKKGDKKVLDFIKSSKNRYFEFRNKKALDNIFFSAYDLKQLSKIQRKYNFDKIVEIIKKENKFSVGLSDKEMKYVAHLLFNRGYLTGESDCFGGALEYVDRTKIED